MLYPFSGYTLPRVNGTSIGPILHPQHGLDEIRESGGLVHLSRGLGKN